MIYYQTIKISPCNPGFSLVWVEILIWDADLFVSGVWIKFIDPWYSVLLVSGVWIESIDPWYFHVFGSSLSTLIFCSACIWCLDRVCRPLIWLYLVFGSSLSTPFADLCLTNQVLYRTIIYPVLLNAFCNRRNHCDTNYPPLNCKLSDVWVANLPLVTCSMVMKQNRTRPRGLQELPKTPCVLAAKLTETPCAPSFFKLGSPRILPYISCIFPHIFSIF